MNTKRRKEAVTVTLDNGTEETLHCKVGTPLHRIVDEVGREQGGWPCLGAVVNNDVVSLSYPLEVDCRVKLLTLADSAGWRIYRNSISFLVAKVAKELLPDAKISIEHSLDTGFYCHVEVNGDVGVTEEQLAQIESCMRSCIERDIPIVRKKMFFADALRHFEHRAQWDKYNLLKFRNPSKVEVHECEGFVDLTHGPLADSTADLACFKLTLYPPGFVIQFADREHPPHVLPFEEQPQLFRVFQRAKRFAKMEGVRTVGDLNERIMSGEGDAYIRTEEAFQEKQISRIADQVAEKRNVVRWVLIAGPSSSGKTTFAKRLRIQLRVNGMNTQVISVDNYFVPREKTPQDADGNYDYEHLEALDLDLFHEHLRRLDDGEEVELPRFDFHTGTRISCGQRMKLEEGQVVLIEGIHSLNPRLTASLAAEKKFRIYISALTQLSLDLNNRISTTDNRLIRRMVRDHHFRGHSALQTFEMWESVRRGEKRWIFPYQDEADVAFSSALGYELAVLKPFVEPLLAEVKPFHLQYADARRLQTFLKSFIAYQASGVPQTSLLREFIGKSGFVY